MNKKHFRTVDTRVDFSVRAISLKEFSEIMMSEKPSEIYHSAWNSKWNEVNPKENAFVRITEYNQDGFMWFCEAHADKTPKQGDIESLYKWFENQGMFYCFFISNEEEQKQIQSVFIKDGIYTNYYTNFTEETFTEQEYFEKFPHEPTGKVKLQTIEELKKLLHSCAESRAEEHGVKVTRIFEKEAKAILDLIHNLNQINPN